MLVSIIYHSLSGYLIRISIAEPSPTNQRSVEAGI